MNYRIIKIVIKLLFNSKVGHRLFGWADGHKTNIGRIINIITLLILAVQQEFPEYQILADINVLWMFLTGILITELGLEHKNLKSTQHVCNCKSPTV